MKEKLHEQRYTPEKEFWILKWSHKS